jgi:pseudouridine kinase
MPKVIVIGGANVDIKGQSSGTFIGGTSNPGEVILSAGGVGRNIADNLARLGVHVELVTVLGDDPNGHILREACAAAGVGLSLSVTGRRPTGTYLVVLSQNGELISAINDMSAIDTLKHSHLEAIAGQLRAADMIVADCNIGEDCLIWLAGFCHREHRRLLIEPVSVPKAQKLVELNVPVFAITPNRQQLVSLTGLKDEAAAVAKLSAQGFSNIVVHRGSDGAMAFDGTALSQISAFPVNSIADVTGAGDAAVAGLVRGLLDGLPLAKAAKLGQSAASFKLGTRESVASELDYDKVRARAGLF